MYQIGASFFYLYFIRKLLIRQFVLNIYFLLIEPCVYQKCHYIAHRNIITIIIVMIYIIIKTIAV